MNFLSQTKSVKKTRPARILAMSCVILILLPTVLYADLAFALDITLAWDANTEPNLMGYYIYYDTTPGPPYVGTDADQGPSPIIVMIEDLYDPENPEYTITGLDDADVHYFAVTAFDVESQESGFSNEASTADATSYDPDSDINFDGSEGCFIGVAGNDRTAVKGIAVVILLPLCAILILVAMWLSLVCQKMNIKSLEKSVRDICSIW